MTNETQKQIKMNKAQQQLERVRAYRKEASRKAALVNKRIKRLEKNNLTDSPAYQMFQKFGGGKFTIRGKNYRETQQIVSQLDKLIQAETSTVRGAHRVLKNIAKKTGMKYETMEDLKRKQSEFFEYVSKYNQYASTVLDAGSAVNYRQVWEAASIFIREQKDENRETGLDIKAAIESMQKSIDAHNRANRIDELFKL